LQRQAYHRRETNGDRGGGARGSGKAGSSGEIMEKLRVGLLFGGRSVEHDVSIVSATSILAALDQDRYEVSLIAVDLEGHWHLANPRVALHDVQAEPRVFLPARPGSTVLRAADELPASTTVDAFGEAARLDVIFPIIHGRGGEDGALQGLFDLADVPYVGSGVLSSALQMDKDIAKRLLSSAGLPVTPWVSFSDFELEQKGLPAAANRAEAEIGLPVYVKPANSGSSIGISRAESISELIEALALARRYDRKVIVETAIDGREIEVAVLGNDEPEASIPGEIRAAQAFYDYDAKYRDEATQLIIPAELDASQVTTLQSIAVQAYRRLEAEGMARVDFLVERGTDQIYINELNSLPGFTSVSMYPKLWEASGLPYPRLLDRLIELALERHDRRGKLETQPPPQPPATPAAPGAPQGTKRVDSMS
jgi:D-alanine-D-alanine ligase